MGGSSSQTIGQRYFAKLTTFIGNPIEKLIGINFDNRGWIFKPDNDETFLRVESPNLYGDKEGGVAGFIDIHTGTADQLPNSTYEKDFPKVSGYPFQSYLLFRGLGKGVSAGGVIGEIAGIIAKRHHYNKSFYHGNSGYMKEMLLWPKRIHVRNNGQPQWYDEKAEIGDYYSVSSGWSYILLPYHDNPGHNNLNAPVDGWIPANTIMPFDDSNIWIGQFSLSVLWLKRTLNIQGGAGVLLKIAADNGCVVWVNGQYAGSSNRDNLPIPGNHHYPVEYPISASGQFEVLIKAFTEANVSDQAGNYVNVSLENVKITDINPIHKIREILTDDTAMNKPESDINDSNFKKAADQIYNEGLGISWSVSEKSCIEAINELCGHIEAGVRVNRQSGLYEMVLFRDDWFAQSEIHNLPVNKIKRMQLDGLVSADELINKLNVSYYNRDAIKNSSFSVAENAAIRNLNGHENSDDLKFPYFMNQRNAAVVTQWKLKQVSTPVWQGNLTTGFYEARKWNRYDLLNLAWPKRWSGTILVRIMKINLGAGAEVSIDFVQVVPYSTNLNSSVVIDTPVDNTPLVPQPALFKAFELSYLEAVQLNGQKSVDDALAYNPDAGYAAVIAKRPQSNSLNALMYTDIGNDYERAGTIAYSETAELSESITQTETTFIVQNEGDIDLIGTGTQITVNNEIMVYQSYDEESRELTVKRGALDTIPQIHAIGSVLYFADDFVTVDPTEYVTGEIINVKALTTTPSGILSLDDVDAQPVEIQARAIRPYPPANVKINGEYWPTEIETDLVVTWVDRNRLQQTGGEVLGWFDGGVAIETNTTTQLVLTQYDENQVELAINSANVTGTNTYTFSISAMQPDTRTIEVILKTTRDGYECIHAFIHTVELSTFFSAPYDISYKVEEL